MDMETFRGIVRNTRRALRTDPSDKNVKPFFDLITYISDELDINHLYYWDFDYERDLETELDRDVEREAVFAQNSRECLTAIARCISFSQIKHNVLARHLAERAARAVQRPLPLLGDLEHIWTLAGWYNQGKITGLFRMAFGSYVKRDTSGRAVEGATLRLALDQANHVHVIGGTTLLHDRADALMQSLKVMDDTTDASRQHNIEAAATLLGQLQARGWQLEKLAVEDAEFIDLPDNVNYPSTISARHFVSNGFYANASFYEKLHLTERVCGLEPSDRQFLARVMDFPMPGGTSSEQAKSLSNLLLDAEKEDVYRALYLLELRKSSPDRLRAIDDLLRSR